MTAAMTFYEHLKYDQVIYRNEDNAIKKLTKNINLEQVVSFSERLVALRFHRQLLFLRG